MKNYELFSVKNGDYVLLDKDFPQKRKLAPCFNAFALKNGHDMSNLIVHANEKIENYGLTASDLKSEDGTVLAKECFKLYNCKYTFVQTNIEAFYDFGVGYYPNAILPMEKAVEYKENKVEKGNNQMLFVSVFIPKTQKEGVYKGFFTLTVDGKAELIPVCVTVSSATICDENHLQCLALSDWDWHGPDKLNDFATYQSYTDLLEEYRMSPLTLIPYPPEENIEEAYIKNAELTYEFLKKPNNSVIAIPYRNYCILPEGKPFLCQSSADMGLVEETFIGFINALIDKSFEKRFNLFKKTVVYFGRFIDEPEGQGTLKRLEPVYKQYRRILDTLFADILKNKAKYEEKYGVSDEFVSEVANSVLHIPQFVTNRYLKEYDEFIDTYCPIFWHLQPEENFGFYKSRPVRWWYGCNGPLSPCPTNHLDDSLLSPRILSWQQYKFDVKGNLIFGVNFYEGARNFDYYAYNTKGTREGDANGDGLMVFPGSPYGLKKPIGSLRTEYIRAGMEDAETLFALRKLYKNQGLDFDEVFDVVSSLIFEYIKIFAVTDTFDYVRKTVVKLLELAENYGLFVFDLSVNGRTVSGKILSVNGCAVSSSVTEKTGKGYSFSGSAEDLIFAVGADKVVYNFGTDFVRKTVDLRDFATRFENINADIKYNFVDYKSKKGDKALNIVIPTENIIQQTKLKIGDMVNENVADILLYFYSEKANEKYERFDVKAKFENYDEPVSVYSLSYIAPQTCVMPVCLYYNDWEKSGKLEYLQISFGEDNQEYKELGEAMTHKKYLFLCGVELIEKTK